ncbi:MAG: phosphoribosylformylglycinamidine synthase subunit PurS [Chlorobiota bacterium]|jgi:phosphoribosylformylglycinamidine synthase|nr:phosphoribosylformylglycinamidine synthase subunit PurS [Chlorobiota bacterium]
MPHFRTGVIVMLQRPILDVQGNTVEQALHAIGFEMMHNVRIGKYIELELEAESAQRARELIEDACRQLLANPVIEEYHIARLEEVPTPELAP